MKERIQASLELAAFIDCHGICHAVKHSMGKLSHEGDGTGIVYGFLSQLLFLKKRLQPTRIIFAWDSKKSLRKRIFPEYKGDRKEKTEEEQASDALAYRQFERLRDDILPFLGFRNVWHQVGYEADDIIAMGVYRLPGRKVIISRDQDLYQLLSEDTRMYDPQSKKTFTKADFVQIYDITPATWPMVKSLAGCPGDNVIGIKGVGEKTAIKFLKGQLKGKKLEDIGRVAEEIYERNKKLVLLPFPGCEERDIVPDDISLAAFKQVCEEHGFQSFLQPEKLQEWRTTFKMK